MYSIVACCLGASTLNWSGSCQEPESIAELLAIREPSYPKEPQHEMDAMKAASKRAKTVQPTVFRCNSIFQLMPTIRTFESLLNNAC
jgi:hypothetical protein